MSSTRSSQKVISPVGWDLLGLLGFALFVVGGTDFMLAWFPARFGNPEWEFGTISAALNSMPAALLGLLLLLVWALQAEARVLAMVLASVLLVWAVFLVGMAVIYGLTLPLASRGFGDPNVGVGLKRAVGRSLVQLAVYPVVMLLIGIRGIRQARSLTP